MEGKCILVVGDDVITSGTEQAMVDIYLIKLEAYNKSGHLPSKMPSIWKCIKEPKQ
jgi:hypothetical protein